MEKTGSQKVVTRKLRDVFKGVTLTRAENGALTVDVSALGDVDVEVVTNGAVGLKVLAEGQEKTSVVFADVSVNTRAYNIGNVLPDGWTVGPLSPYTAKPIAIEPVSGAMKGYHTWNEGQEHAQELHDQGHANARQPSLQELIAIYNDVVVEGRNRHAKFITRNTKPYGKYWASTLFCSITKVAYALYLGDGDMDTNGVGLAYAYVRCVRDEVGIRMQDDSDCVIYSPGFAIK